MVGKKRFAASEKRKAIRWLGARCVTGSEQAVGAVGAVTASEQSTTEAMEVEVVGTVAMAMSASSPRSPMAAAARGTSTSWMSVEAPPLSNADDVPTCVATLVEARARANAVAVAPMSCAHATLAVMWDASKPLASALEMPVQTQVQVKQQRRGRARMNNMARRGRPHPMSQRARKQRP